MARGTCPMAAGLADVGECGRAWRTWASVYASVCPRAPSSCVGVWMGAYVPVGMARVSCALPCVCRLAGRGFSGSAISRVFRCGGVFRRVFGVCLGMRERLAKDACLEVH